MSRTHTWWAEHGHVDNVGTTHDGALNINPAYRPKEFTDAEMLAVADRVLAGVKRWRAGIVETAKRNRGVADELAEALAEIARLKGEGGI
jgi:hypothetical protein